MSILLSNLGIISQGIVAGGKLESVLQATGRLPTVELLIYPLQKPKLIKDQVHVLKTFLTYQFSSSIVVPVDSFSFTFCLPDHAGPVTDYIKDGDLVQLSANGYIIGSGIIDSVEIETEDTFGEKVQISGRDLMGQLEDQDAVSLTSDIIWFASTSIRDGVKALINNTRVNQEPVLTGSNFPTKGGKPLMSQAGESKLAALQRFLEPYNVIAWMSADGRINVGRPNMQQSPLGRLVLSKTDRFSNVLQMKATYSATTIPNVIIPVWGGQESVSFRLPKQQQVPNVAEGPLRLNKAGHKVPKMTVTSIPTGDSPQDIADKAKIIAAGQGAVLQAYAKRELARQNMKELIVQAVVPGHYNDNGIPFQIDQVYHIQYDRAGIDRPMYLYQVDHYGSEDGQKSSLYFCKPGTIVADIPIKE